MGFKNKKQTNLKLSRKQLRKQKRQEKKNNRHEYYTNRRKPGQFVKNPDYDSGKELQQPIKNKSKKIKDLNVTHVPQGLTVEQQRKKEQKEQRRIEKQMNEQRKKQLVQANVTEDRNIKQLEKQLGLNKRKAKGIPKSFDADGLGYLLEVCDSDSMKGSVATEKELQDANNDFEEDFALMTGSATKSKEKNKNKNLTDDDLHISDDEELDDDSDNFEEMLNEDDESDLDIDGQGSNFSDVDSEGDLILDEAEAEDESDNFGSGKRKDLNVKLHKQPKLQEKYFSDSEVSSDNDISEMKERSGMKRKNDSTINKPSKKIKTNDDDDDDDDDEQQEFEVFGDEFDSDSATEESTNKVNSDGTWEDIYGRLRGKDGSVIQNNEQKYIPPAIRLKMEGNLSENDKKRSEKLSRLRKQLKGYLNRLAEGNMHSISSQIEELYMNNSRNDMNDTLTSLILESLVSNVITPERLLMEHVLLVTVLHANIGTEIGAHFLQTVIKKFDEYYKSEHPVENKMLDNIVNIIAQLYNFKLFDSKLVYEVLEQLSEKFEEKDVECILHILRSVGFGLRKDDPLALKNLILKLQRQAASVSEETRDNSRIKFMLDILLAIKNNNVTKIPNYDTTYSEHLKKIMKGFIRKGNYVSQLNISLEDLLKVGERGRWWVVGSAWAGNTSENTEKSKIVQSDGYSQKLLELAKKQRMNTDTRRNIFCIIMSAEDYLDAFEKLLKLGLKNQQEREIIHVILHCCLHEKVYNPYYSVLAQKFCDYDRKYQMTIKYSVWDKLKALNEHSGSQISNLAKLLTHLFMEKGLPISTLKIVQFSELDKITLRFIRQILLGILLHPDLESIHGVFEKVIHSDKLKMFRDSLRLFIHHFLLRNLKTDSIEEQQKIILETRAKMVEKVLISKEGKLQF